MKNDKFCVSKTLSYLVALVVAVVGAFYVMNYVNTQKVTTDSEASAYGGKCTYASVKNYPGGCGVTASGNRGFSTVMNKTFVNDPDRDYYSIVGGTRTLVSRCCVAVPVGQVDGPPNTDSIKDQQQACKDKANEIVAKSGQRCTYYDGGSTIRNKYVYCSMKMSDDFNACTPAIGQKLAKTTGTSLKELCADKEGTMVPGSKYTSPDNQNRTCLVYTGGYRSGNQTLTPAAGGDLIGCLRVNAVDLYNKTSGTYRTSYCQ